MLRIHTVTSATEAKKYYAAADYYKDGVETVGRWGGKLAERLGLAGTVDRASFERLCDNLHPREKRPLTPRTNEQRRVGYDLVFSGPKSFSLLEALADDAERTRLRAAFDDAVTETIARDVEPDIQTRDRRNGGDADRSTGNLLWAGFDHSTARPVDGNAPDPHRHKHVVVFNATYDPVERRVKAGQFGAIKRDGEYYAAAFYARLAAKLEAMGYVIDRRGGKAWEIAGVPQSAIDTFSKRTDEVEEEHAERLRTDPDYRPGNKHELGAKTRAKKSKELTPEQLRKEWDGQLTDAERRGLAAVYGKQIAAGKGVSPAEAMAYAIAHCSEQHSAVPERELKRVALLHGLGGVLPERIGAELPRHGVIVRDINDRRMATTEALQREEHAIVGLAAGGRGTVCPLGVPEGLKRGRLNEGQWQAVLGLLQSSNRVNLIEGPAGAGKSSMLSTLDEGIRRAGGKVAYLATTTGATDVLSRDGFEAGTVASFLFDEKAQQAAKGGRVVIDETSMLGHKDATRLFELAAKLDLKLIFVGDPMQHGSVPRGALMRLLKEYGGIKPFRLTEIMRQEDAGYRAAATLLSEGCTVEGFDAIDRLGFITEMADPTDRYRHLAADYVQALEDKKTVLVVSPTHAEAGRITREIRAQLRQAGKLGAEEREFTRLVAVNASEAERSLATTYRPGDVIQFHQNAKGFKKGERFTVSDPAKVPVSQAGKFSLYRPQTIALAKGDRIRFTGTVKTTDGKHKLSNGATHTVDGFTRAGNLRLENGWELAGNCGHFRSGFVETSFGSQGRTVQRVLLGMAAASLGATNQEQMYVSSSRARERMTLYTDNKAAVRAAIQRSSQKLTALDLVPKKPKPIERVRRHMARLRKLAVIERVRQAWETHRPGAERQVSYGR